MANKVMCEESGCENLISKELKVCQVCYRERMRAMERRKDRKAVGK
jgi:hypothetical protein